MVDKIIGQKGSPFRSLIETIGLIFVVAVVLDWIFG